ncbi:MAG: hypothetical protein M0P14_03000 [Alkaliphilus sp.]|nr:hypothetical protein [Alkaliphilus sp.]
MEHILKQTDLFLVNIFEGSFSIEPEANIEKDLMLDNAIITGTLDKFFDLLGSVDDSK